MTFKIIVLKVSQKNQQTAIQVILFGVAYFVFAKPVLNFLGITKGAGERAAIDESKNPNSPFNPNLWQTLKVVPNEALKKKVMTAALIIHDAMGYVTDNEDEVFAAIKAMRTKTEISMVAYAFQAAFGKDLVQYLQKGRDIFPQNGLSDSELKQVFSLVARLPNK